MIYFLPYPGVINEEKRVEARRDGYYMGCFIRGVNIFLRRLMIGEMLGEVFICLRQKSTRLFFILFENEGSVLAGQMRKKLFSVVY